MRILSLLAISILLLSACKKEDVSLKLKNETSEQMMGKWMVQRIIYEVSIKKVINNDLYKALNLLNSKLEVHGSAHDCFDFQGHEMVQIKTSESAKLKSYNILNPSQVMIGHEEWRIEKLTATELELKFVRDAGDFTRVTRMYLNRSL